MMKREFQKGDKAHLSVGYNTKIFSDGKYKVLRLKLEDEVEIFNSYRTDAKKTSGYMYVTNKGEIPQEKLFSKAQWEKYSGLKARLESAQK